MAILRALLGGLSLIALGYAQRPTNASICDYYAELQFGVNTTATQVKLIEGIVALAFGGAFNLTNISSEITGILHPGTFNNEAVDLQPWFNGSKASTNLNNQPVGINWLDGGGTDPLYKFLSGGTETVEIVNTTNQYRLFGHFFIAFGYIFGCSTPPAPLPGDDTTASLSLAYVHKFMNLTYNDIGHFIDMLTLATVHYGFSDQDSRTFSTNLNSRYNVRCAPAVTINPKQGPQLFSLCQNPTCPLAEPNADCAAYVNLTANGTPGSANTGTVSLPASTSTSAPSSASSSLSTTTTTTAAATSTSAAAGTASSLSPGAIGGIAVGGAAVVGFFILGLIFLMRRRNRRNTPPPSAGGTGAYTSEHPSAYGSPSPYGAGMVQNKGNHQSYVSNVPTTQISEMGDNLHAGGAQHPQSGYYAGATSPPIDGHSPGWHSQSHSPGPAGHSPNAPGYSPGLPPPQMQQAPAELAGYEAWRGEHHTPTYESGTRTPGGHYYGGGGGS